MRHTLKYLIILIIVVLANNSFAFEGRTIYYTDIDGLPLNIVKCTTQDDFGYTWIGTINGIARFDGYTFLNYEELEGLNINAICTDKENAIWTATDNGIYCLNRTTNKFELIQEGYFYNLCSYNNAIYALKFDRLTRFKSKSSSKILFISNSHLVDLNFSKGHVYISRRDGGIITGKIQNNFSPSGSILFPEIKFSKISVYNEEIWLGSNNGKVYLFEKKQKLSEIPLNNHHKITDIEFTKDRIYIATDGNGILILDNKHKQIDHLSRIHRSNQGLSSNSVYDIQITNQQVIWVSTYGGGITVLRTGNKWIKNIFPVPGDENSIVADEGTMSFVDSRGNCWLGTNYGLSVKIKPENKTINFDAEYTRRHLNGSKFLSACEDSNNCIWTGLYDGHLTQFYYNTSGQIKIKKTVPSVTRVRKIITYNKEHLLICTNTADKPLFLFNIKTGETIPINLNPKDNNGSQYFQVISMKRNCEGKLLLGLRNKGLFYLNFKSKLLEATDHEINDRVTFSINDFHQTKDKQTWFATNSKGLVKIDPQKNIYKKWDKNDGLPTNQLIDILSINDSILWISSIKGLIRFNTKKETHNIFNYQKGLISNEFKVNSSTITNDNNLIFGNTKGFTVIDPGKFYNDTSNIEVVISDIIFYNQSIKNIEPELLTKPIEQTNSLKLPFNKNSFTINFFARHSKVPKYNEYSYRMSGFEEEWIYIKDNTSTTYTNLPPGNYTFEVRCTNENNSWSNNITRLKIKIAPPWYLSWGAFLLYFITFNAGIYFFLRYYTRKIKMKKEIEVANLLVEKEKELSEKKLSFFTNLSHDLKTPLTLITAPLDQVIASPNLPEEHKKNLLTIKRNALKLRTLINDILDFRKIINKRIALNIAPTDLNSLLNSLYSSFNNSCKQQNITLTIHCNVDQKVFIDSEKIEKILWNLLSNALKFTNLNGIISLHAKLNRNNILEINVKDNGKGIKKEEKTKIFNRFYQSDNYAPEENTGSGIGLSIVKELVQVHKGKINVHSVYGEGTEFTLEVPADKNSYPEEIKTGNQPYKKEHVITQETAEKNKNRHTANHHKNQNILIAEDNEDLLDFLQQHFKHNFNVSTVKNGKEALDQVNRKQPDLIISDIMMPQMNGVLLCHNIKTNFDTSHIPIILLTADSSDERKIAGMEVRADAYVTKPFNIRYLDALVDSLIQNRVKLKEHFLGLKINKHSDDGLTKEDKLFIEKFQSFVNENYSSADLDIDKMALHMACSRSQFNRKVKALLGITPSNLLKQIRLKKAYELLKNDQISVSEAAFKTGFTDPNYFTSVFKKEFKKNPSQIK